MFDDLKKLAQFLLTKRENDTKSMVELLTILKLIIHSKGVDGVSSLKIFFIKM